MKSILKKNSVEKRLGFKEKDLLAFPKYLHIETINSCNARCLMCGINFDEKKFTRMGDDLFSTITEELSEHAEQIEKVMPYLDGEPLLDKDIFKRVRKLKDANIKIVNISTNASLLTATRIEECLSSGLDQIYITIDSLIPEVYEEIRKGLKFEDVLKNTLALISKRNESNSQLKIRIQMVLQKINSTERESFIKYWKEKLSEGDEVVVQNGHNWAGAVSPETLLGFRSDMDPCIALWGTFVCHSNGEVPLCCMDTKTKYKMGDLNGQSIKEVWSCETFTKMREIHTHRNREDLDLCNNCDLWSAEKKEVF
ncbi:MAG: radical SAM protein with 4Fe4S-binding SPASM domain [Bacteriovoracaceae bacterium]|jgi:radical SAM protein with 4Fe4S-binding SPASM domain